MLTKLNDDGIEHLESLLRADMEGDVWKFSEGHKELNA